MGIKKQKMHTLKSKEKLGSSLVGKTFDEFRKFWCYLVAKRFAMSLDAGDIVDKSRRHEIFLKIHVSILMLVMSWDQFLKR